MPTIKNLIPLLDNVLIRPLEAEEATASGIILPDTAKEKPQIGEIIAVGPGRQSPDGKTVPIALKVGQFVVYKKWGPDEIRIRNQEWVLVKENDILGIAELYKDALSEAKELALAMKIAGNKK